MRYITFYNIRPFLYYNVCRMCGNKKDLHECNDCLELYCIACDLMIYNCCKFCYIHRKRKHRLNFT